MPLTLEEIQAAVDAGEPETMTTAGTAFDAVSKRLKQLSVDLNKQALDLAGEGKPWVGEGANAFATFTNALATKIGETGLTMEPYKTAMDDSAAGLADAKKKIDELVAEYQKKLEGFQQD